jgi:capsular exopolysaccharide synthesis family protein
MEMYRTQKTVLNEMEILKSSALTERTLNDLDFNITYMGVGRSGFKEALLYNSCPFIVQTEGSDFNPENYPIFIDIVSKTHYEVVIDGQYNIKQKVAFGEKFSSDPFSFSVVLANPATFTLDNNYNKYYFQFNSTRALVNKFKSLLSISTNDLKRGSVLILSITGNSPQQITDYLNKLMEVYISKGLEDKNQTAINTVNFIDQQLNVLDTSLKAAEKNLQDFRLKNRLMNISQEGGSVYSKLESLQNEKITTELQTRYFTYLQEYVKNRNNLNQVLAPSIIDITDPILSTLVGELNTLLAEKSELLYTVQPGNPKISLIESKIESAREALLDNLNNLFKNHSIKISELEKQLALTEKEFDKLPETERIWISIQREYKVNDQIYTYWLQKRAESAIAKAANVADNKIVDFANVDNAALISPKARSNNMMGLIIGLAFPLAILILVDLLNNKISSRSQIERKTSVPIISTIGHSADSGEIPVFELPKSGLAESFRSLRTNLQYMMLNKEQKIIMITSTISGEGKTFCSTNLASIFAMAGKKTLLIGLDLRKPKVHKVFNLDNSTGISTCLLGTTSFDEIIKTSKIDNLFIAPAGPIPPNPAELLGSPAMEAIIAEARQKFDIIILDTPPFGVVTDSRLISRLSDLSLFILRQNYSTINVLELLQETYLKNEAGHMGLIINDIRNKGYYGYGYRYYNYGSDYRYGYYNTYGNYSES